MNFTYTPELMHRYPGAGVVENEAQELLKSLEGDSAVTEEFHLKFSLAHHDHYMEIEDPEAPAQKRVLLKQPIMSLRPNRLIRPNGFKLSGSIRVPDLEGPSNFWDQFPDNLSRREIIEIMTGRTIVSSLVLGVETEHRNNKVFQEEAPRLNRRLITAGVGCIAVQQAALSQVDVSNKAGRFVAGALPLLCVFEIARRGWSAISKKVSIDEFDSWTLQQTARTEEVDNYETRIFKLQNEGT